MNHIINPGASTEGRALSTETLCGLKEECNLIAFLVFPGSLLVVILLECVRLAELFFSHIFISETCTPHGNRFAQVQLRISEKWCSPGSSYCYRCCISGQRVSPCHASASEMGLLSRIDLWVIFLSHEGLLRAQLLHTEKAANTEQIQGLIDFQGVHNKQQHKDSASWLKQESLLYSCSEMAHVHCRNSGLKLIYEVCLRNTMWVVIRLIQYVHSVFVNLSFYSHFNCYNSIVRAIITKNANDCNAQPGKTMYSGTLCCVYNCSAISQ